MYCENSWTSRNNVIRALSIAPDGTYSLSIRSTKFGESFICSSPQRLVYLLYQLPTKNSYKYEKISTLAV